MVVSNFVESDNAVNAVVTITKPAEPGRTHHVQRILATFSNGSTGSEEVVVTINAVEVFRAKVEEDAVSTVWNTDLFLAANEAVVVTLDAGGALNTGRLVVTGRTL